MEELKKVLDQFGIDYKVAVDEPHAGRPISKKVAQFMEKCSASIFVFTKDEKFMRETPMASKKKYGGRAKTPFNLLLRQRHSS